MDRHGWIPTDGSALHAPCNMASHYYRVAGCGAAVVLVPDSEEIPVLICASRGGVEGTECADCDTSDSQRVVEVRGLLGAETVGLLDGERYRPLAVTYVRFAAE